MAEQVNAIVDQLKRIRPGLENSNSAAEDAMVEILPKVILTLRSLQEESERLKEELAEERACSSRYLDLERENALYRDGILAVDLLIKESAGVSGLHLNGNLADWSSLLEGGCDEEWLRSFSKAVERAHSLNRADVALEAAIDRDGLPA